MKWIFTVVLVLLSAGLLHAQKNDPADIEWNLVTDLPPAPGQKSQIGLAGLAGGVHNNAMIIAGGANFPDSMPWKGGKKKYWSDIYVLLKNSADEYEWLDKTFSLPKSIAYAATATVPNGVLCIGGENENGILSEGYLLQWDPVKMEVEIQNLPSLPIPLTNASASVSGNQVFVVGGQTKNKVSDMFLMLDLSTRESWKKLPSLPVALSHTVAVVQSNGSNPCLYVIGGRTKMATGISELHGSVFEFDIIKQRWEEQNAIQDAQSKKATLSAATAIATGANYILVFGGDKGELFSQLEQIDTALAGIKDSLAYNELLSGKLKILTDHPGFSKSAYLYNTITNSWSGAGSLPASHVTTFAVRWGNDILIPSGEIKPGVRTSSILRGSLKAKEYFAWLDYVVVIVYLLLMIGIGLYTSKNQGTTNDYFKGGQRIPGWAAGLSIYGTQLSAITFMSIPAKTYATNWNYFILQITIILVIPIITNYFIPFYRKLQITTAYEYLEKRFNYACRALASILYVMLQFGRLAIVLLLPSLALTLVTGLNVNLCILLMGVITIFYTMKGGIEAVVWTDVAQVIILLGGALVCLVMIILEINTDAGTIFQTLRQENKFEILNTSFNITEPTLWVVLFGGLAINVISYGADQSVVQKYLTTKDEEGSKKSMRLGAWMALPSSLIFFSIGTLLYLFYREHPEKVNYQLQSQDAIFPWYIVSELPAGVTGLLIAAVFAAAMSTLSSSMNSVTTALITDFYRPAVPHKSERSYLKTAKIFTLVIGVIGTGLALLMATLGVSSLWDQFNTILGLFTGGLGGLFVLGIFTKRANGKGALAGLIVSGIIQFYVSWYTQINLLLYAFIGLTTCVFFGYLFSLVFGPQKKDISGLTVYKRG